MPYARALERLKERDVYVRVLAPPYAGVGVGELRVVRAEERGDAIELVVTYADYQRLEAPKKPDGSAGPPGTA